MNANQLSLNLEKTQFMLFNPKNAKKSDKKFDLRSGDHHFEETNIIKFLGIPIPSDLKFKTHYENIILSVKINI